MKVALFEPYIFERAYGNQKYILGLFKYLDRERVEMLLISQRESPFLRDVEALGGRTRVARAPELLNRFGHSLLHGGLATKLRTALAMLRYTVTLYRLFGEERIDVLQCHNLRALLVAAPAAKLRGIPVLWYVKGHLDNPRLDRIAYRIADRVLFQAEANRRRCYPDLQRRYRDKTDLLPNGLDLEQVEALAGIDHRGLAEELAVERERVNIAYLGQISPLKGVHVLIRALSGAVFAMPAVTLYLIGDHCNPEYADYTEEIRRLIAEHGLADQVRFTGFRPDALEILSLMDMMVLPSFSEGVPRSIMEAMALGKPVIATGVGGIPDLLGESGGGMMVPPDDVEALSTALVAMVTDERRRREHGARGRCYVRDNLSLRANTERLQRVYQGLME